MGLPMWRDPEEKKSATNTASKSDPTACARSSIRRRPSVHGRRVPRPRLPRDLSTRFERSPPPPLAVVNLREPRRDEAPVPPVSTLLESADRHAAPRSSVHGHSTNEELARRVRLQAMQDRAASRAAILRDLQSDASRSEQTQDTVNPRSDSSFVEDSVFVRGGYFELTPSGESIHREIVPLAQSWAHALQSTSTFRDRLHEAASTRRGTLPTPPLDTSAPDEVDSPRTANTNRRFHPLSNSWRPESPIDGLGDRDRSLPPADGWEIIRTTITPDETLPSADSSFTSAAASQSFNAGNDHGNSVTTASDESRNSSSHDTQSDSISSIDPDDLICTDEEVPESELFAHEMYRLEESTPEGRDRINAQVLIRAREGNRFGLASEPASVDIGFRLIEAALDSAEGRERLDRIREVLPRDVRGFDQVISSLDEWRGHSRFPPSRPAPHPRRLLSPHPERYSEEALAAARDATQQVHDYFSRYAADAMVPRSNTSPPPRYEADAHGPSATTLNPAVDPPADDDSSPTTTTTSRASVDALVPDDLHDLDAMRRVVERLAARDDVPDEWWMSIGLNLSRARPSRPRSPPLSSSLSSSSSSSASASTAQSLARQVAGARVRAGRIQRGNPRS